MGAHARRAGLALALSIAPLAWPAHGLGADPALEALRDADAYVSPRVSGAAAPAQQALLARSAARLAAERRPVKLAVVAGPVGSPSLQIYARRLAAHLDWGGTLIITSRRRAVAATGPRPTAEMTRAMRAGRVGRIADPVERLTRAAELATPPPSDLDRAGRRATLVLLLLAALGGGWAAALGIGREGRRSRRRAAEARARTRVCVDALRARTLALARRSDLPPETRLQVLGALGTYADLVSALPEARTPDDIEALDSRLRAALDEIAATESALTGEPLEEDPFAGLCGVDPAHGPAVTTPVGSAPALCEDCRDAAGRGDVLEPRMLFEDDRPVRFDLVAYGPLRPGAPS